MNWLTRDDFPTPAAPRTRTRYGAGGGALADDSRELAKLGGAVNRSVLQN